MRPGYQRNLLGGTFGNYLPPQITTLGPKVNNIISGLDHVQVMLNHNYRISCIC